MTSLDKNLGCCIHPLTPCLCNSFIVNMSESVLHNTFIRKYLLLLAPASNSVLSVQQLRSFMELLNEISVETTSILYLILMSGLVQ